MIRKYDAAYLRDLKSYREHRTGVLQVSKKAVEPLLNTIKVQNESFLKRRNTSNSRQNTKTSFSGGNHSESTTINEAVAEYKIKSYTLNDRLFVENLQKDTTDFQSTDRPPLVRYSNLPNSLKYERISVPKGVLEKPTSLENCLPLENIVEPSLAATAHCMHGWIAPRARSKPPKQQKYRKSIVDMAGRTFGDFDIRSAMSDINYEEQTLNHVNEGIDKSTLRGMLIVADDNNRFAYNNVNKNDGMANTYVSPYKTTSYTQNEYADGVVNQPRTWGVGRSELFDHFSSGTKKLLKKEEEVRKPILRRIKMY